MKFIEIKVHALPAFVTSDEFRQMPELPVSSLRAHSHAVNPCADPNDIGLIYALNEHNLVVGYIGIMPARAYSSGILKIYFVSCWWAHPETGRGVAMKLFFMMLEITQKKVLFFQLPEKMAAILKAMGSFTIPPVKVGFKGFIRMDLYNWLSKRNPRLTFLKPLLYVADKILNLPVYLHFTFRKTQLKESTGFYAEQITQLSDAELKYISDINKGKTVFRGMDELNWVIENPWISAEYSTQKMEAGKYRFSLLAKEWKQNWIRISDGNEIRGIVYQTIRDGVAAFPYAWFKTEDHIELSKSLAVLLLNMKVTAIQLYNPFLLKGFAAIKNIFVHRRPLERVIAWPKEMNSLMEKEYILQDGDGDSVFT